MESDVTTDRLEWESPAAFPISDIESRADRADIWMLNDLAPLS